MKSQRVWIVRIPGQLYALLGICTHLGCTPRWLGPENKFKCPCHGSGYTKDGVNFEGPTPRPLERVKIVLGDDGQLVVDKAFRYRYELGQWDDPNAYVKFTEHRQCRHREAQALARRARHQQLRLAVDLPPRLRRHAAQPRAASQRQRLAAPAPVEDAAARHPATGTPGARAGSPSCSTSAPSSPAWC